ncbi:MAG: BatA and WFA domain-containing protein [Clostridia bacterium]|nr:BatA and WFA domain-containing protein [Clostridia bacterium]
MSFAYPLGLLGLLGIPVLILIYIIKSKYTEQIIPSTYLWELSEKFLKRKRPISKVAGIISLILQILIVLAISLIIAHPVFTLPNSARDYCFILDGTGSMRAEAGGSTRFDRAKSEIKSLIGSSHGGSNYALVFIGDTTYSVFEGINNKDAANALIDGLDCTWSSTDCVEAVEMAQKYFDDMPSTTIYLVTDKAYGETENITVIDVSGSGENYAVTDYSYVKKFDALSGAAVYSVTGSLISYNSDAVLTAEFYVDGGEQPHDTRTVSVKKLEKTEIEFIYQAQDFSSMELRIKNADGFMQDNSAIFYETKAGDTLPTLLVSDSPFYLRSMLTAVCNTELKVMTTEYFEQEYFVAYKKGEAELYGLYVFDCYAPAELPKGGTVWLFNPTQSIPKSGFSFQTVVDADEDKNLDMGGSDTGGQDVKYFYEAEYEKPAAGLSEMLLKDINVQTAKKVAVKKYSKYAVSSNFTTLLSYNKNPLIFAGTNENNDKQVVVSFAISDSNYALDLNYLILMRNLFNYSSPAVLDKTMYTAGDTLSVNVLSGCTAMVLRAPSGKPVPPLSTASAVAQTQLTEAGTYTLTVTINGEERVYSLFAGVAESESYSVATGNIAVSGTPSNEYSDGYYDDILIYLIILAVFFMADWGVYCYEQYQLR